jgi:hypothetical protein
MTGGNQEKTVSNWLVAKPSGYTPTSSQQSDNLLVAQINYIFKSSSYLTEDTAYELQRLLFRVIIIA